MTTLFTDVPTESEIRELDSVRNDICVSIYLPTTPGTSPAAIDRLSLRALVCDAILQLTTEDFDKREIAAIENLFHELCEHDQFWARMAEGLAIFATPTSVRSFRLPVAPIEAVKVSDRFYIKPLVPLLFFPAACFVLALSPTATRLIEVTATLAETVFVDRAPKYVSDILEQKYSQRRGSNSELHHDKSARKLMGQHCWMIDRALRPILVGRSQPLILAGDISLEAAYRTYNGYPHLVEVAIQGNPDGLEVQELAAMARKHAINHARALIRDRLELMESRATKARTSTDVEQIARAAIHGQIETLLVDIDASRPGTIDSKFGTISFAERASPRTYDILDELVGLTIRAGGVVFPISASLLPARSPVAAILR